jgi:hypothetical protein
MGSSGNILWFNQLFAAKFEQFMLFYNFRHPARSLSNYSLLESLYNGPSKWYASIYQLPIRERLISVNSERRRQQLSPGWIRDLKPWRRPLCRDEKTPWSVCNVQLRLSFTCWVWRCLPKQNDLDVRHGQDIPNADVLTLRCQRTTRVARIFGN